MTDRACVPLSELIAVLDTAVRGVVAPDGDAAIDSVVLVEPDDPVDDADGLSGDVLLEVGFTAGDAERWFAGFADVPASRRPAAVLSKQLADTPAVRRDVARSGVALIIVDRRARWDVLLTLIQGCIDRARDARSTGDDDLDATGTDLFGLAALVADGTGGMVSIEDAGSRVLAYSQSDETADDLRVQTILGRSGPPAYLRLLREWGVYDAIRRHAEPVEVPAHPELALAARMVVGVHLGRRWLGAIWVQAREAPFADDAAEVLRGASTIAARIIARTAAAPTT
ncbi:MAG: CdaR family transcriptional regulator, partial [Gordonia sp. (in: high G+C Gram-positive bacteria)]